MYISPGDFHPDCGSYGGKPFSLSFITTRNFSSQCGLLMGVLHHTGNMTQAFENVSDLVKNGGHLFISIYNDQGGASRWWTWIKRTYNRSGCFVKMAFVGYTFFRCWTITMVKDFLNSGNPFKTIMNYGNDNRGMTVWYDLVDWAGGYPFEVAKPEVVFDFFANKGFQLKRLKTLAGGLGCNEFVFVKD